LEKTEQEKHVKISVLKNIPISDIGQVARASGHYYKDLITDILFCRKIFIKYTDRGIKKK
jgi:hypothetical protein